MRIPDHFFIIAYKLSVEALSFGLIFGFGFILAEIVLPGFLSDRIHFFLMYTAAVLLLGLIIWLSSRVPMKPIDEMWGFPRLMYGAMSVVLAGLLMAVMKNLGVWPKVTIAVLTGVTTYILLIQLMEWEDGEQDKLQ